MAISIDRVIDGPFDAAVQRVKDAMKAEGFGTLTEIDVQATLREKLGKEIAPYRILGVCNPRLADHAISVDPRIGVFLPCSVVVREVDGEIHVNAQDPQLMKSMLATHELDAAATEARERIEKALDSLGRTS